MMGFWSQVVLLGLLDTASLMSFARERPPWYHLVGFAAVNIVLLLATALMWQWMRQHAAPPPPPPPES